MHSGVSQQAYTSMMKFTIDGRPYLKDILDLFAALIIQIPLGTHRSLFRNYPNTFTSDDAIQALGSLRFSHTARTQDPNNPSKQLCTTTTTTFNMEKDMAKALCQQFQVCHLMENAVDPTNRTFRDKGVWQLTAKGVCVLQDFCVRTEADMSRLRKHFAHYPAIQLVRLERHTDDDQLLFGRQNLALVFRIMMTYLPTDGELESLKNAQAAKTSTERYGDSAGSSANTSANSSVASSSSSTTGTPPAPFAMACQITQGDSRVQLLANNLLTHSSKRGGRHGQHAKSIKTMRTVFSTQLCCDWLTDYTTVSCREESEQIACEFLKYGWIAYQDPKQQGTAWIKTSKSVLLTITAAGKQVVGEAMVERSEHATSKSARSPSSGRSRQRTVTSNEEEGEDEQTTLKEILSQDPETVSNDFSALETTITAPHSTMSSRSAASGTRPASAAMDDSAKEDPKETNATRLKIILDDPQLRSLFKDFLRSNFCEENLDFWIDYSTLRRKCRQQSPAMPSQNQKDLLEDAYDIWSTYLAPGAQCALNVDHSLSQEMARLVNAMVNVLPTYTPGQSKPAIVISTPSTSQSLRMMLKWFDRVNEHICRLMASDSVPKFIKTPKYRKLVESREQDQKQNTASQPPPPSSSTSLAKVNDSESNDLLHGTSAPYVENQA